MCHKVRSWKYLTNTCSHYLTDTIYVSMYWVVMKNSFLTFSNGQNCLNANGIVER